MNPFLFPPDFKWGVSTSSYQIEGGANAEGRGPSVWDTFCKLPGRVAKDASGDIACDHYHRWREDIDLIKDLNANNYRFSLSWSRLFPSGEGAPNPAGFAFYDRLIDTLLEQGIEPWITLFHWDLPDALEKRYGGWSSREIVSRFGDYATEVGKHYGDRVKRFFTTNEFFCFTDRGYSIGEFPPGLRKERYFRNQTRHHALLAQGTAVQALRASAPQALIGLAEDPIPTVPIFDTPEHVDAARKAYRIINGRFLTAILEGAYPDEYLEDEGADAPTIGVDDFEIISSRHDFFGFNAYTPTHVRASSNPRGFEIVPKPSGYPRMNTDWLYLEPDILYWSCRFQSELWKLPEIYISENGCACDDRLTKLGEVLDTDRIFYLRHHLRSAQRATHEGYPLKGYFQWSLLDNFEWAEGYEKRFGLFYVNFETLKRTQKLSAQYFSSVASQNRVL
jgi:beta-glucosidase